MSVYQNIDLIREIDRFGPHTTEILYADNVAMDMSLMRFVALSLAVAGFFVGMFAAGYWLQASRIDASPVWGDREPVDPLMSQAGWIVGLLQASSESARLNRHAAVLTAVAVVLTTGSGVAGLFA